MPGSWHLGKQGRRSRLDPASDKAGRQVLDLRVMYRVRYLKESIRVWRM